MDQVVQNGQSVPSVAWHKWFSCKAENERFPAAGLCCNQKLQFKNLILCLVDYAKEKCIAQLFLLIPPIMSLLCGAIAAFANSLIVIIIFQKMLQIRW